MTSPRPTRAACFAALLAAACGRAPDATQDAGPPPVSTAAADAAPPPADAGAAPRDAAAADASSDAAVDAAARGGDATLPGETAGCPDGMVRVRGNYCPATQQICAKHHKEYEDDKDRRDKKKEAGEDPANSTVSERCLEYREPSECVSKERRPMDFCVDRYEYPNEKGQVPALLLSWVDAKKVCESLGKRLCTEEEFNFACEGEAMLPYTYGYVRDPSKCNIDKPYRKRKRKLYKYERCMKHPECKAELARIDQRAPAGSMPECVSPFGVYDMNGNINEWVMRPGKKYPDRSGLKGGWWGPVRGRCRPTVGFHKEEDYGYEEGFRCCKDSSP